MDKTDKDHWNILMDRFARGDDSSRSETALLELLLTYSISKRDVQPLAARLLLKFGNLSNLLDVPIDDLSRHEDIKRNSAVLLKLVDWICKHYGPKRFSKENTKTPYSQDLLFDFFRDTQSDAYIEQRREKLVRRNGTEMFSHSVLKEAIQIIPSLPDSESLDEIRSFLRAKLHFNAEETRRRYANYITRRMFPEGYADTPLRLFAKKFPNTQELRDICFYRFILSEPLELEIIEDLITPNIGVGRLSRERIRSRLSDKFPNAKSIFDCGQAIVDALTAGGIAKADRTKISFAYREIPVPSFAFVLHSEFPEPGMYEIRKLDENRMIRAMLWNPERFLHALYELRNQGLISKISEIDNIRQFTTKHTLAGVVEQIVSGGN